MRSRLTLAACVLLVGCAMIAPPSGAGLPATPPPTVEPSATPSASPTPEATPSPSPTPSPTPDPGVMQLEVDSCNGGTVLRWTASTHPDFHHYVGLRSPEREIEPQYPPIAPAVDWGDLYATDRFVTTGHDATVVPSDIEWNYLVVAYDERGRPVSRSNVASGRILPYGDLGEIEAEPLAEGGLRLSWDAFDGNDACFTAYRVLQGTGGVAGSVLTSISDRATSSVETTLLDPGVTYTLRVRAVRATTLGQFVAAESAPLTVTVPDDPS